MSRPAAACPNCGAPVEFRWSGAVQTVCPNCRSVLVRHDVDLRKVGEAADLPPDVSPIQIGTTGRFEGDAFRVTGRIVYEYDAGTWNEWHLEFLDGTSGWLSDAQLEYAVSRLVEHPGPLPESGALSTGQRYSFNHVEFAVATLTRARYRGVDGELPFEYWDKDEVLFADLASSKGQFATIDYSETPPLLFIGAFVDFDALELANLRPEPAGRTVAAAGFNCRNCGAAIELRAIALTKTVACTSCGAIQDPSDPNVLVLQGDLHQRVTPTIPLGSNGTLGGYERDVIGFQRRTIVVDGVTYGWNEYLLYNRQRGFSYLSEYEGHWNVIRTVREMPEPARAGGKPAAVMNGVVFKQFQTALATTDFVLGEFPWQVRRGDTATVSDYIAPPLMLSAERTPEETTWSLGTYTDGRVLWEAFGLVGDPPRPVGIFANQPSPFEGRPAFYWTAFAVFTILLLIFAAGRLLTAARRPVFAGSYNFTPGTGESSFVTPEFEIGGRPSNVAVRTTTPGLSNNWIYLNLALIDADTGEALDFGREVSYYSGTDSDGSWSEGSRSDEAILPTVPPGRYYLRVEPEGDRNSRPISYTLTVVRDVPSPLYYLIALGLALVPPLLVTMRSAGFETVRWQESDYAPDTGNDDDD
jgi:DNA-directed RNA polymerase subunit RPC12/RpoP